MDCVDYCRMVGELAHSRFAGRAFIISFFAYTGIGWLYSGTSVCRTNLAIYRVWIFAAFFRLKKSLYRLSLLILLLLF